MKYGVKKESNLLIINKLLSYVILAGLKPTTPTSVVWYSIQLSYRTNKYYSDLRPQR